MTSIQSRSAVAKSQAAQSKKASSDGWQYMPHVNQIFPRGADANYVNGPYNCGASVVAMVARGHGKKPNLTDAQLITHLARGNTTETGSTPDDVANMLKRAGVPVPGNSALGGPFDGSRVKDQLKKGRMLIAQVGVRDSKTGDVTSHYILIKKKTADGKFVISDPLKKKSTIVSAYQLAKAVDSAPPDGGMMIPVGRPGGDLKPETPQPPVPQGPEDLWAFRYGMSLAAYRAQQPFQAYPPASDNGETIYRQEPPPWAQPRYEVQDGYAAHGAHRAYEAQRFGVQPHGMDPRSVSGFDRSRAGYSMQDQFMGGVPSGYPQLMGGLQSPAPAAAAPKPSKPVPKSKADKNAFVASDDEFKGVKGEFVAQSNTSAPKEKRVTLRVSYQRHGEQVEPPTKQMKPRWMSVERYADKLLRDKSLKKEGIEEKLARLELSPFKKDKEVMALIKQRERKQGGSGKKFNYESCVG